MQESVSTSLLGILKLQTSDCDVGIIDITFNHQNHFVFVGCL